MLMPRRIDTNWCSKQAKLCVLGVLERTTTLRMREEHLERVSAELSVAGVSVNVNFRKIEAARLDVRLPRLVLGDNNVKRFQLFSHYMKVGVEDWQLNSESWGLGTHDSPRFVSPTVSHQRQLKSVDL